jgi:hypothetical protein
MKTKQKRNNKMDQNENNITEETITTEGIEMTESPVEVALTAEDRERVEALRDNVVNMFAGQLKRADKNPVKQAILKEAVELLTNITLTSNEMAEILNAEIKGSKTVKWSAEKLKFTNVATYVTTELEDKIPEMNESMAKKVYMKMLEKFKGLNLKPAIMPCPMANCMTNEFVQTTENTDGTWTCACTNAKHFKITINGTSEIDAINAWNSQVSV